MINHRGTEGTEKSEMLVYRKDTRNAKKAILVLILESLATLAPSRFKGVRIPP